MQPNTQTNQDVSQVSEFDALWLAQVQAKQKRATRFVRKRADRWESEETDD
jgi:hypothetical protein